MWKFSYWVVPLVSAVIWLAMLLSLLLTWIVDGKPIYSSMQDGQTIAYISDVGADKLKPLFISMGAASVVLFDLVFIVERWLRHSGKLVRNTSTFQKVLSALCIIAAVAGAAGLILLSIFDTKRYHQLHDIFLAVFIGGYIVSAIFTCWEYQRLGMHFREHSVLRMSFWVKLVFILLELALAIAFGVLNRKSMWNNAAIVEWVIALVYTFYVLSFFMDFVPAVSRGGQRGEPEIEQAMDESEADGTGHGHHANGRYYGNGATNGHMNGHSNGYANGYTNGHVNGHKQKPSRNF